MTLSFSCEREREREKRQRVELHLLKLLLIALLSGFIIFICSQMLICTVAILYLKISQIGFNATVTIKINQVTNINNNTHTHQMCLIKWT